MRKRVPLLSKFQYLGASVLIKRSAPRQTVGMSTHLAPFFPWLRHWAHCSIDCGQDSAACARSLRSLKAFVNSSISLAGCVGSWVENSEGWRKTIVSYGNWQVYWVFWNCYRPTCDLVTAWRCTPAMAILLRSQQWDTRTTQTIITIIIIMYETAPWNVQQMENEF